MDFSQMKVASPSMPRFTPSPLQQAIFDEISNTRDNLIIEAVAGSGKTTTIVKACNYLPSSDDTLFLAFNKAIVTELQTRLPGHITARTFHSIGMQACREAVGRLNVNSRKSGELIDEVFGKGHFAKKYGDKIACSRLIGFAKANGHYWQADTPTRQQWQDLIEYHDLNFESPPESYLDKLTEVYMTSLEWQNEIDFDDMLLHPIHHNYEFPRYDNIICDESQDLSSLQHEILRRVIKPEGRIIAVGDTHQAIYGFRGADSSSMGNLKEMFSMRELPLNVSYRCSQVVRDLAKEYVPHFECLETAPPGTVETIFDLPEPGSVSDSTMVLCRLNAPLFRFGIDFLSKGVAVQLWTNLDQTLKSRILSFKAKSTAAWRSQLQNWYQKEYEEAQEKEKWSRCQTLRDTFETLWALSENTTSPKQIVKNLTDLTESKRGPILSTIHKAKGQEAEQCLIVNYNMMPSRFAKLDWMKVQENNLIYVALTRAKTNLILHYFEDK